MPAFYFELRNPISGFTHKSWLLAASLSEAKTDVRDYAPLFGASCRVVSVTQSKIDMPTDVRRTMLKPYGTAAPEAAAKRLARSREALRLKSEKATTMGFKPKSPREYTAAALEKKRRAKYRR